jgi:hypothetical protein
MFEAILQKYQTKESGHQSAFEVREKFKQSFDSPSGSVPWQNERV